MGVNYGLLEKRKFGEVPQRWNIQLARINLKEQVLGEEMTIAILTQAEEAPRPQRPDRAQEIG